VAFFPAPDLSIHVAIAELRRGFVLFPFISDASSQRVKPEIWVGLQLDAVALDRGITGNDKEGWNVL
jgi:hypothetical protein